MPPITIRPPTFSHAPAPKTYSNPSLGWLLGEWHVTHSTLPMWKDKRNVRIKYSALAPSSPQTTHDDTDRVDDLVTYQSTGSDRIRTIHGLDKASRKDERGAWDWRGRGWLVIAGSHWEVLGWGQEEGEDDDGDGDDTAAPVDRVDGGRGGRGNKWVVTMFAKTLFTPAGIDVYSGSATGVKSETLEAIKRGLQGCEDGEVKKLAGALFEIKRDDGRDG